MAKKIIVKTISELREAIRNQKSKGFKVNRCDYFDFLNLNMNTIVMCNSLLGEECWIEYEGE